MNEVLSVFALISLTGILLLIPLIPAFLELTRKSDAKPLQVIQKHGGEIRHFSEGFREYVSGLNPILQKSPDFNQTVSGTLQDKAEFLVLGSSSEALWPEILNREGNCSAVIAACSDFVSPPHSTFSREIYSKGKFSGGDYNYYRAILGEKDVQLGANSVVMRWIHAIGILSARRGCELHGRVSSDTLIHLDDGCSFVRLNAPRIELGPVAPVQSSLSGPASELVPSPIVPKRFLYDEDFELIAGQTFLGNIVTRGNFIARKNSKIIGSIKSSRNMTLENGVLVTGSVISSDELRIGSNCVLQGPVVAERTLHIESGARVGAQSKPTTVSSPKIVTNDNVVVFGTLWAREHGEVVKHG